MSNPHRYEANWTVEDYRDELIDRLGSAIKRINELEPVYDRLETIRFDAFLLCLISLYICGDAVDHAYNVFEFFAAGMVLLVAYCIYNTAKGK